jgi:cytochrome c553
MSFGGAAMLAAVVGVWGIVQAGDAAAQTPGPDPQMVSLGQRIFKDKVACNQCHGWSGNGVPDDSRMPVGANLRASQLTGEQLAEVVKCGRPGTEMPHFDARAYEDDRCYGVKREELGSKTPPFNGVGLIPREVQAVVAYLEAKVVGRGPFTRQDCEDFFGKEASVCNTFNYGGTGQPPGAGAGR